VKSKNKLIHLLSLFMEMLISTEFTAALKLQELYYVVESLQDIVTDKNAGSFAGMASAFFTKLSGPTERSSSRSSRCESVSGEPHAGEEQSESGKFKLFVQAFAAFVYHNCKKSKGLLRLSNEQELNKQSRKAQAALANLVQKENDENCTAKWAATFILDQGHSLPSYLSLFDGLCRQLYPRSKWLLRPKKEWAQRPVDQIPVAQVIRL